MIAACVLGQSAAGLSCSEEGRGVDLKRQGSAPVVAVRRCQWVWRQGGSGECTCRYGVAYVHFSVSDGNSTRAVRMPRILFMEFRSLFRVCGT